MWSLTDIPFDKFIIHQTRALAAHTKKFCLSTLAHSVLFIVCSAVLCSSANHAKWRIYSPHVRQAA